MFFHDHTEFAVDAFSHRVRLFPLADLVVFPRVLQPLHVFEPRYRALLADALADDRLIAMALYQDARDSMTPGAPPLCNMCCLGRVTQSELLPDGRSNLLLAGLRRVRIIEETAGGKAYREATVEVCEDAYSADRAADRAARHEQLLDQFLRKVTGESDERLKRDLSSERVMLGALTDIISYTLPLESAFKQQLLEELDVDRRADLLSDRLQPGAGPVPAKSARRRFPPDFSAN